jgi:hypothetical protein
MHGTGRYNERYLGRGRMQIKWMNFQCQQCLLTAMPVYK